VKDLLRAQVSSSPLSIAVVLCCVSAAIAQPTRNFPETPRGQTPHVVSVAPGPERGVTDDVGLAQISVGFDTRVVIPDGSIRLWGVTAGPITGFTVNYDYRSDVAIVTLPSPIQEDRVTLVLDYTIVDAFGHALDGEIADPTSPSYPSGDGRPGGQAVFRFHVLQGDANRDGVVNGKDGAIVRAALGSVRGDVNYDLRADFNDDGAVDSVDARIIRRSSSAAAGRLPTTDPSPFA
jgi:dockerin type I repeat protein